MELEFHGVPGVKWSGIPLRSSLNTDREYRTTIISRSGTVGGKILHGKDTTIKMKSGSLDAQILPYGVDRSTSLTTVVESGAATIELLMPPKKHGHNLTGISSSHTSRSGQLQLKHPDKWQGSIHGVARSGSRSLTGADVEITDQGIRGGKKYIHAQKGRGLNKLKFDIKSGAVDATIGH
jgi:hypothetical protein